MKYTFSFTSGALFHNESIKVAKLFIEYHDWDHVQQIVLDQNLLQRNTRSTSKTIFREIRYRLSALTEKQLQMSIQSDYQVQKSLLFLSVCKYYQFIADFTTEVLRNKMIMFDPVLTEIDYRRFWDDKLESHPEMEKMTKRTARKVQQVTIRLLVEAGLLIGKKNNEIVPAMLPVSLEEVIMLDNPKWLKVFLMSDQAILNAKEKYAAA